MDARIMTLKDIHSDQLLPFILVLTGNGYYIQIHGTKNGRRFGGDFSLEVWKKQED